MTPTTSKSLPDSPSLKIAVALALLRSQKFRPNSSQFDPNPHRWKLKAKERKREILRLREELKRLEDGGLCEDEIPTVASCRCYFFDGIGVGGGGGVGGEHWIDEVLRRRFLRLVRWKERRQKVQRPLQQKQFLTFSNEDQLGTSIDFLMGLIDGAIVKGGMNPSFSTFCHQAVDFISVSIRDLRSARKEVELVEEIVSGLILRLIRRMCNVSENDVSGPAETDSDVQFCVQHLIRKLGNDPYVGQMTLLLLSQKISAVSERLLFMDPFDESFPCFHGSMFMMIQLLEFLISDYMRCWISAEDLEKKLLEEWISSVLQARKASELLESRNGLYVLYMERITGELAKLIAPLATQGKLDSDLTSKIFC